MGKLAYIDFLPGPACLNSHLLLFRPINEIFVNRFLYYVLGAPAFEAHMVQERTGTTFFGISQESIGAFPFVMPPISEQKLILEFLDRETAKIDSLIDEQRLLVALLKEKRKAFISHAVTKGLNSSAPMRDSGIEWIGRVPEHWSIVRTRMLFDERDQRSTTGGEEMLTVSHLTGVTRRSEKNVYMFEAETNEGYKLCKADDLVINTLWGWMGAMGTAPEDGMVSPAYNVYEPNGRLIPDFIDPLVRTRAFVDEVTRYSKGVWSSRLRIYPAEFFLIYMPVPPIEEQRDITDAISRLTNETERLCDEAERGIVLLQERRSALISAAVTGKINVTAKVAKPVRSTWSASFARQVLAAETLSRCNGSRMGRIKLQKLIHLCEYHAQLDEVRGAYSRQAAGPFAPQVMEDVREGLLQQRWFEEYKDDSRYAYRALEKAGGHKQHMPHWEDKRAKIDLVLNLLGGELTRK